jgi:hypothetical protein
MSLPQRYDINTPRNSHASDYRAPSPDPSFRPSENTVIGDASPPVPTRWIKEVNSRAFLGLLVTDDPNEPLDTHVYCPGSLILVDPQVKEMYVFSYKDPTAHSRTIQMDSTRESLLNPGVEIFTADGCSFFKDVDWRTSGRNPPEGLRWANSARAQTIKGAVVDVKEDLYTRLREQVVAKPLRSLSSCLSGT